jgi:amidase
VNDTVHAILEVNPDALQIAATLDKERLEGRSRGPLHGLPVMIKGNIGTRDRMQTNAGSHALQGATLPSDSTVVTKLRDAGLITLGKSSLTEWSMMRCSNSTHAWNPITGQGYGAYCEKQCPGGSSGGSAVAADLGLAWATIGTEVSSPDFASCIVVKLFCVDAKHRQMEVSLHQARGTTLLVSNRQWASRHGT